MTRSQMIETVARKTGFTEAQVETTMDALFDQIADCLRADEKVTIAGFGRFEMRPRKPKAYTNPKTKVSSRLESTSIPGFKASGRFKQKPRASRRLPDLPASEHERAAFPYLAGGGSFLLTSGGFHDILMLTESKTERSNQNLCSTANYSAVRPSTRPWSGWALRR